MPQNMILKMWTDVRKKLFKPVVNFVSLSCTRNVVVKIGYGFLHAGVLPKHVLEHKVIEDNTQKAEGDKWFESVNNIMRLLCGDKKTTFDSNSSIFK